MTTLTITVDQSQRCLSVYKPKGRRYAKRCRRTGVGEFGKQLLCEKCARRMGWINRVEENDNGNEE